MIKMQRGFKSKLDAGGIDAGQPLQVMIQINGNSQYDFSCFALGENEKVLDGRYVVFFNQTGSPNGEISLVKNGDHDATFDVNLALLPPKTIRLCFSVTVDGSGLMREISACTVQLMQNGQTAFQFDINGSDFQSQKAIITVEIYNKNGWRVAAVANGFSFSGGLSELMAYYGVNVSENKNNISPRPSVPHLNQMTDNQRTSEPPPPPVRCSVQEAAQPQFSANDRAQAAVNNGPASGKNAEGFDRNDDDWV